MLDEPICGCLGPPYNPPMHAWYAALQAENFAIGQLTSGSDTSRSLFIFQFMDFIRGDNLRIGMDMVSIGVNILVHTLLSDWYCVNNKQSPIIND